MPDFEIFLSWSKSPSRQVAEALREWLPEALPDAKPWMSSEDITKGRPWFASVSAQLSRTPICILCITTENVNSHWLYYEAGAIAHAVPGSLICPYLIGLSASALASTPLGQFQCTVAEKDDTRRLILSINKVASAPHNERVLANAFDSQWPSLQRKLSEIVTPSDSQTVETLITTELSPEADKILLASAKDQFGNLMISRHMGGLTFQANQTQLCDSEDPRAEVLYRAALSDLVARGLMEDEGNDGKLYRVTAPGFELADKLSKTKSLVMPSFAATDDNDITALMQGWINARPLEENTRAIVFATLDHELNVPPGSSAKLLEKAAAKLGFDPVTKGPTVIIFRHTPISYGGPSVTNVRRPRF